MGGGFETEIKPLVKVLPDPSVNPSAAHRPTTNKTTQHEVIQILTTTHRTDLHFIFCRRAKPSKQ